MKNKKEKGTKYGSFLLVLLLAAGAILVYIFFAYFFYVRVKTGAVKEVFRVITDMDLSSLDEDDEEILQGYYRDERIEIIVADEELRLIYTNRTQSTEEDIERYIENHLEEYQEQPTIHVRQSKSARVIRLRGLVVQKEQDLDDLNDLSAGTAQKGTEVPFYVYIRKEIRAAGEVIRYTAVYFTIVLLLLGGLGLFLAKRKPEEKETCVQEGKKEICEEDLVHVQKEFVANVSHELKTPLAVISGQVEMLQKMGDGIDRDYYFSSIREEIDKMSDMVSDLLNITNIEHHMAEMELEDVNLSDMMEYMILKYDALFRQNKLRLQTELAENCVVRANHMYLEQAINNYIMNAFQHTAQGREIRIRLVREQSGAVLYVYNDGELIGPENMERIWQDFYMGPKDSSGRKNQRMANAGLGLYLVKKIVEQHRGSCGVENKEKGVEFWMRIPLA